MLNECLKENLKNKQIAFMQNETFFSDDERENIIGLKISSIFIFCFVKPRFICIKWCIVFNRK